MSGPRSKYGLTLFEMLVVLTIVIILTVLTLPLFLNFNNEYHATATTQNLYYALQYARSEAVKRDATVYVNFQTGTSWCYGINAGSNCTCSVANSCGLGTVTAPASSDLTLTATGLTGGSISFEGSHGAAGAASTITFTVTGQSTAMGLDVAIMGDLQMCSTTISGYSAC